LLSQEDAAVMQDLEESAHDAFFVVLSDVHLDVAKVQTYLQRVLQGFSANPPAMFIIMGSFTSKPFANRSGADAGNQCTVDEFGLLMDHLGDLLASFPSSATRFVIVPGPNDPSATGLACYPRPGLPRLFSQRVLDKLPEDTQKRVCFASNPCRVFFHMQEICIFRDDVARKMTKHAVVVGGGAEGGSVAENLVKTLVDQAHLLPLPTSPVFFAAAESLSLVPLPSICILADATEQFVLDYAQCGVMNPGSFAADGSFVVYRPAQMTTEFSRVQG
jgi:DNA polymerase epsilon subunit 2